MKNRGLPNCIRYIGYGIFNDVRSRIPHYKSDIQDAWNYRIIPSTLFIFFANLLPAISFAQDMYDKTDQLYGVNETLMSSAIAGVVFGMFSGQPLCMVGVTGPITIFNYTVYELMKPRGTPFFPFMCWIYLWSMVMHFVIAITNMVSYIKIITLYSADVFGFFVCVVYLQKGVQILNNQFAVSLESGYCSVMISLLMVIFGVGCNVFGNNLHYFRGWFRKIFSDYGMPLAVIFFTAFTYFGGNLSKTELDKLPITKSFQPTHHGSDRSHGWFIHFWPPDNIAESDVFLAIPFAIDLTLLFYFDHNISSLMCQLKDFPLKKPSSFHWDFALLGLVTGISGLIGLPAPNGLIPQAPLHTQSLVVHNYKTGEVISVVEQRVSNTIQGLLTFLMMSGPLLVVLGLIPQAVLAGLFFIMGITGIHENSITNRIRYLFLNNDYVNNDPTCPLVFKEFDKYPNKKWFYVYLVLLILGFGAEFAITLTKGTIGFPGVLLLLAICAKWVWPLIIPLEELQMLDSPVADEVTIKNLKIMDEIKSQESSIIQNNSDIEADVIGTQERKSKLKLRNRNQNV
ncbi:unnamed protein product [Debaryomyces tyrocola]|nr:unnamed protein product [Debaryomyces tyrocola]